MAEETTAPAPLDREITVRGHRFIWERHTSDAHLIDLMILADDSEALGLCGALVLAYPRMGRTARFKRNVGDAATRLYAALTDQGWSPAEIMEAGGHAFRWLAGQLPPTASSPEVEEAENFTEPTPDDGSGGSEK